MPVPAVRRRRAGEHPTRRIGPVDLQCIRDERLLLTGRNEGTSITERRLTVANPDVMYRSMNICLAADICERLKRNLKFDLSKAEFVGDREANRMRSRAMRAPYMV